MQGDPTTAREGWGALMAQACGESLNGVVLVEADTLKRVLESAAALASPPAGQSEGVRACELLVQFHAELFSRGRPLSIDGEAIDHTKLNAAVTHAQRALAALALPSPAPGEATADHEFEVWQDDMMVAGASSHDRAAAYREALHYAAMYGQDGPVEVFEITRSRVTLPAAPTLPPGQPAPPPPAQDRGGE